MQLGIMRFMENFAERLRFARKRRELNQQQLAELSGVGQPVISKLERGAILRTTGLVALAQALDCSPVWLETGEDKHGEVNGQRPKGEPRPINLENNPDYPAIRRVALKAHAGVTGYAVEYMNDDGPPIVFRKDWYTLHGYRPEKMMALRVAGESMVPNLYAGDLIVINSLQTEPKDGIVFVCLYEGEVVAKRLVRDSGQWWLTSDNADQRRFPRKACDDSTQVVGEVVYRQTERI
jgi:phage repressor protein C with HTH and peptisase S24 domain